MSRLGPVSSSAGRKPGTPTIGSATGGDSQATVTFTAPTYLGKPDSPLTYTVVSSPSSIQNTGSGSPITVTGLSNGTSYSFTVKLSNTVLDSEFSSASNNVSPASAAPPPPIIATPPPIIATPPPPSGGAYYALTPTSISCANGCGGQSGTSTASCSSCGGCPSSYKCCYCPTGG